MCNKHTTATLLSIGSSDGLISALLFDVFHTIFLAVILALDIPQFRILGPWNTYLKQMRMVLTSTNLNGMYMYGAPS